jgi:hypothetical protein
MIYDEDDLVLGEKVGTLEIHAVDFRSFAEVHPGRYFDEVILVDIGRLQDISVFSNVQKISLEFCRSITDIGPLRNVPYLRLCYCDRINDYSCLGAQHYLEIRNTDKLLDEDLNRFGNIRYLKLSQCSRIERIGRLSNNGFIEIYSCASLCDVNFPGSNYIRVKLIGCARLSSVSISGWIYLLTISGCGLTHSLSNYTRLETAYEWVL